MNSSFSFASLVTKLNTIEAILYENEQKMAFGNSFYFISRWPHIYLYRVLITLNMWAGVLPLRSMPCKWKCILIRPMQIVGTLDFKYLFATKQHSTVSNISFLLLRHGAISQNPLLRAARRIRWEWEIKHISFVDRAGAQSLVLIQFVFFLLVQIFLPLSLFWIVSTPYWHMKE